MSDARSKEGCVHAGVMPIGGQGIAVGLEAGPPSRSLHPGVSSTSVHLCYVDEAGTTGKNLEDRQQPIFAMAGLLVSDEKWRKTESEVRRVITNAYESPTPADFELHACELLAPKGEGPFVGWDRDRRNGLALDLLRLVDERRHQVLIQLVNKQRMAAAVPPDKDFGFDWRDPWEVGFAAVLTMAEEFLRSGRTGRSSTGMVVIDHEPSYLEVVRRHSRERQLATGWKQVRKVMEIGYSATSHANPMIQRAEGPRRVYGLPSDRPPPELARNSPALLGLLHSNIGSSEGGDRLPGRPRKIYRSARTGQFVRKSAVKRRPSTTVTETVKPKRRGKK